MISRQFCIGSSQRRIDMKCVAVLLVLTSVAAATPTTFYTSNDVNPLSSNLGLSFPSGYASGFRRRCPICDSSVFGYCSDKLFHDSCCCHNPNNPYDRLPFQCQFADCDFLHANSCQEHKLISACCCTTSFLNK